MSLAHRKLVPYPWKGAADNMEDTYAPRKERNVVVSNVSVGDLVAVPLFEERVVSVHGQCGPSQVPSLAELRLCGKQLVEEPPGLGEIRFYPWVFCAEEIKEDEVFDRR